jgi:superfamily II DNA/RNA helicase
MIWRDGALPPDAPNFSLELSDDLLGYGYSLLLQGMRFAALGGEPRLARTAFEVAAESLEAVVAKGAQDAERDFHRLVAAAAYHLGRFSARAYSLLHRDISNANLSVLEASLAKLMLRDLDGLARDVEDWFREGADTDESLVGALDDAGGEQEASPGNDRLVSVMNTVVQGNFMGAMGIALLAFERGEESLIEQARTRLTLGLQTTAELSLVAQWWCHRLTIQLLEGLWDTSFHHVLPRIGPPGADAGEWVRLRRLFISSLYRRSKAEVELWPSQLEAAGRVLEFDSNLVLSLPTSAGKTRIAEMCILACLAQGKRVVFVTPLRALSAQTEVGLRKTFNPLGKSVSSLYGSIGASGADVDALRTRDIVVATPEKLDFALRSDPSLLDDVGLVVLDEGHMIGLSEREVRYEAQIQRLLRRSDAASRRVVCLSAILPEGDQLADFAAWLTNDKPDGLIKDSWRPTRLRFGEVDWRGKHAQLNITVGDEKPYILKFFAEKKPTKGQAKKMFPSDQRELCLATAWRLVEDGQTVLVFCPERRSVLPYAKRIVDMHKRGHLNSVLAQPTDTLTTAMTVGAEWFGENHVVLQCLRLGVAVHHGALPTPYRKEVERLLREGVLKITISSPTLAQGLNLAATSLIFHGLTRASEPIDISEFRNVVGRAGRAYIDIEGLVLYPMFDRQHARRAQWNEFISSAKGREMESGLLRLLVTLPKRMQATLKTNDLEQLSEYVLGQGAWDFASAPGETVDDAEEARVTWRTHLMSLDTAIFSLFGDQEVEGNGNSIEAKLDELLASSLLKRRLERRSEAVRKVIALSLTARARYIWSNTTPQQRRGYFLAGVGLATGKELDKRAPELEELLLRANVYIGGGEKELAVQAITAFAQIAFEIEPFAPRDLLDGWVELLRLWLLGHPLTGISQVDSDAAIIFVEQAFVYSLPWAMEAVRVRAAAHEDMFSDEIKLSDYPHAHAVSSVETGTLSASASLLIQSGFASRLAAIRAVEATSATFDSMAELESWLRSEELAALSKDVTWPTKESHQLWLDYLAGNGGLSSKAWTEKSYKSPVKWSGVPMPPGTPLRIGAGPGRENVVLRSDFEEVGTIPWVPNTGRKGIVVATATGAADSLALEYIGPDDLLKA